MKKSLLLLTVVMMLGACASPTPEATPTPVPTSMPVATSVPRFLATPTPVALTETSFIEPIRKQIFDELVDAQGGISGNEEARATVAERWGISVDAAEEIISEGLEKGWLPAPTTAPPTATPIPPTAIPAATPIPPTATPIQPTQIPPTPIPPTPTPIPPTATPPQGTPPPKIETPMIAIPAGQFTMGSDHEIERPPHLVFVEAFEIDKFKVTNEQFERFVWETGYVTKAEKAGDTPWRYWANKNDTANRPVVKVSWNDAKAFCEWAGKRLPSEAEWEKAARGTDARTYPWGNEWEPENIAGGWNAPVGSNPAAASPYGVMDMAGHVGEWTSDWFQPYPGYPGGDSAAQYFGEKYRVIRGGGWSSSQELLRTTHRSASSETVANDDVGFRCAR